MTTPTILDLFRSVSSLSLVVLPFLAIVYGIHVNALDSKGLKKLKKTLVAEFKPPQNLSILEVAVLLDNKLDFSDLSAELLNLILCGVIKFDGQNLIFEENNHAKFPKLPEAEQDIINILFEDLQIKKIDLKNINQLSKNKFYAIKKYIYDDLTQKGYYEISPLEQREIFYKCTNFLFISGIILVIANIFWQGILFLLPLSFLISAFILAFFGENKAKKTPLGFEVYQRALGYKYFIQKAEKDRITYLLKNEPDTFYQALPYAYLFKVTTKWQANKNTSKPLFFNQFKNIDVFDPSFADSFTKSNILVWFWDILRSYFSILAIFLPTTKNK